MFDAETHPCDVNLLFRHNPIVCDGNMDWVLRGMGDWITVGAPGDIVCSAPPHLAGVKWEDLNNNDLWTSAAAATTTSMPMHTKNSPIL